MPYCAAKVYSALGSPVLPSFDGSLDVPEILNSSRDENMRLLLGCMKHQDYIQSASNPLFDILAVHTQLVRIIP